MGMADFAERYATLSRQEEGGYQCQDYLLVDYQPALGHKTPQVIPLPLAEYSSSTIPSKSVTINEVWREKICEWTFQVIDHFDFNREIASISLNYLDRYLSKRVVRARNIQLAAITSLFLAIKLYEPTTITMSSFIELSCGHFKTEHITIMESSILWTLSWYVHPPTPLNFVSNFMSLLEESGCSHSVALEIKELVQFLTELSVCDYYFTTRKPSSIGLGALLTAFDRFDEVTLPLRVRHTFFGLVHYTKDPFSKEVQECKGRLCETYSQHTGCHQQQSEWGRFSPNCVANLESSCQRHCDGNLRNNME